MRMCAEGREDQPRDVLARPSQASQDKRVRNAYMQNRPAKLERLAEHAGRGKHGCTRTQGARPREWITRPNAAKERLPAH